VNYEPRYFITDIAYYVEQLNYTSLNSAACACYAKMFVTYHIITL